MIKRYKVSFSQISTSNLWQLTFLVGDLIDGVFTPYDVALSNTEMINVRSIDGEYYFDYIFNAEEKVGGYLIKSNEGMPINGDDLVGGAFLATLYPNPFISTWRTTNLDEEIILPLTGSYNLVVDWGDGSSETVTDSLGNRYHSYGTPGDYTITIDGNMDTWSFRDVPASSSNIISISQWGVLKVYDNGAQFANCSNLTLDSVSDILDLTGITNLNSMFEGCTSLTTINRIDEWDVSSVSYMSYMFKDATSFNGVIRSWNVSNVSGMGNMFQNATSFNGDLSAWDISNVFNIPGFMHGKSTADYSYYDNLLNAWSQLTLKSIDTRGNQIVLDMGTIQYTSAGEAARQSIIDTYGWVINDGGLSPNVYFNSITLDSIVTDNVKGGDLTVYSFTINQNLELIQTTYAGQLVNGGGDKMIMFIAYPTGITSLEDQISNGISVSLFDSGHLLPFDNRNEFTFNMNKSPDYSTWFNSVYSSTFTDLQFKMVVVDHNSNNIIEVIETYNTSFDLISITPTTTTTTTVSTSDYYIYDFTSHSNDEHGSGLYINLANTRWDGTYRIVATDLNSGTEVYYIGTDGDKHLFTFPSYIADGLGNQQSWGADGLFSKVIGSYVFDSVTLFVSATTTTTTTGSTPTFITSKLIGEQINIYVQTSTGYWKYNHNSTDSRVFSNGWQESIEVLDSNGEFTIIPCLSDGTTPGEYDVTYLELSNNQITSFDGTGLRSLTTLSLTSNQLTSLDNFIFPIRLITLTLEGNQLTGFNRPELTNLTTLQLGNNLITEFDGTNLTTLLSLELQNNQLTSINLTGLSGLNELYLSSNQLTSLDLKGFNQLQSLNIDNNPFENPTSINDSLLSLLAANELSNGWNSGEFFASGGSTELSTTDYDYLILNNWVVNLSQPTTTTTTTTTIKVSDYSLTFRKMGSNPKNAPLTIAEFEGNFGYIADYVSYLLSTLSTTDNRIAELETNISGLINRIAAIDGGQGSGGSVDVVDDGSVSK